MRTNLIRTLLHLSRLDGDLFARLTALTVQRLTELQVDGAEPTPAELDRCTRLLGVRLRDLSAGFAERAPMTLLFKSAFAFPQARPSLEELADADPQGTLGDFLRAVRDCAELEELLGVAAPPLPTAPLADAAAATRAAGHPVEQEARRLRDALALGLAPVRSMRELLARLSIHVFFTTPDELDPIIDGASTRAPRPAVLVNLVGGGECWWRTRMTLAHELAHLLHDAAAGRAVVSPHRQPTQGSRRGRWQLFEDYESLEIHADAFAACFLAPAEGVRRCVAGGDPSTEGAIAAVGATFGVGRTVAINRLRDVFGLPAGTRAAMLASRPVVGYAADFQEDRVSSGIGVRTGVLARLVQDGLLSGRLGQARAHEYLGVPLRGELPLPGVPAPLRGPAITPARWIEAEAQRLLGSLAAPGEALYIDHVEPVDDRGSEAALPTCWRVRVRTASGPQGTLLLDANGLLLEDQRQR